ncbi:iron donor protein CyaY [Gallaecimonas sp. GXIMD4217]|uniref:iron donor protein CyaY n=1 Tax=Gallaecimonas sp. GXIMD4217 TaxID=3131927 RepID=UPI00311B23C7
MTESEYHQEADRILLAIEEAVDAITASGQSDIEVEGNGGIVELHFEDGSKMVINKQEPLLQIWVATRYNGHHFEKQGDQWVDRRGGGELKAFLDAAISRQAGVDLKLGLEI